MNKALERLELQPLALYHSNFLKAIAIRTGSIMTLDITEIAVQREL